MLFLVFMLWLRGQTWLDPAVFALTAIAAVIGSLIGDVVAFTRARVPYVSDVRLPGEDSPETLIGLGRPSPLRSPRRRALIRRKPC